MCSFIKISKFLRIIIVVVGGTLLFFIGIGIGVNIVESDHNKSANFYSQKNKKHNLGEREKESKGELGRDLRGQSQLQSKLGGFTGKQDVPVKKDAALLETSWLLIPKFYRDYLVAENSLNFQNLFELLFVEPILLLHPKMCNYISQYIL